MHDEERHIDLIGPREYPSAPIVGVGAVVIERDCVLLVRRAREPGMGEWSLPGGAVELGESLEQAIVREAMEETGLTIAPINILKTFDRIERDLDGRVRFHYVLVDFLSNIESTTVGHNLRATSDVSDAQWARIGELRSSKEFVLPDWTLAVIEDGWRRAQSAAFF